MASECFDDVDGVPVLDDLSPAEAFRLTLKEYLDAREAMIRVLRYWAKEAQKLHRKERIASSGGNLVAVAGAGMTVVGGVMTALSFGTAAPLLAAGVTISFGGVATAATASVVEKIKEQGIQKEIRSAEENYNLATVAFEQQSARFAEFCKQLAEKKRSSRLAALKEDAVLLAWDLAIPARVGASIAALLVATAPGLSSQSLPQAGSLLSGSALSANLAARFGVVASTGVLSTAVGGALVVMSSVSLARSLHDLAKERPGELSEKMAKHADELEQSLRAFETDYNVSDILEGLS